MCPRCRQNAPIVYRGVNAYCTACGAPRMPLAASSVNLAGQPSKVGGTVARVFGWLVLGGGWLLASLVALVAFLVAPGSAAPWILGVPLAVIATVLGWVLLRSGRQLEKSGDQTEQATKNQAMFALANTHGGVLTAWTVAQAFSITPQEADARLTQLAKEHPDYVTVDVDDNGTVLYRFLAAHWSAVAQGRPPVRVDATPPTRVGEPVRVEEREPVELEAEAAAQAQMKAR